jgi:glycopeptide antibiotics resistance protein
MAMPHKVVNYCINFWNFLDLIFNKIGLIFHFSIATVYGAFFFKLTKKSSNSDLICASNSMQTAPYIYTSPSDL